MNYILIIFKNVEFCSMFFLNTDLAFKANSECSEVENFLP